MSSVEGNLLRNKELIIQDSIQEIVKLCWLLADLFLKTNKMNFYC